MPIGCIWPPSLVCPKTVLLIRCLLLLPLLVRDLCLTLVLLRST